MTTHAPAQPKKKHTVRNIFLILFALFVLSVGGCMALIGGAASEMDKAMNEEAANDKPSKVTEGKAFEHDIWSVKSGWSVKGGMLGADIKGLRAEHIGDSVDTPMLTFTLDKGNKVLASIDCSGPEAQPGQIVKLTCMPAGKASGYQSITVRDLF